MQSVTPGPDTRGATTLSRPAVPHTHTHPGTIHPRPPVPVCVARTRVSARQPCGPLPTDLYCRLDVVADVHRSRLYSAGSPLRVISQFRARSMLFLAVETCQTVVSWSVSAASNVTWLRPVRS